MDLRRNLPILIALVVAGVVVSLAHRVRTGPITRVVVATVGEIQTLHATLKRQGRDVLGVDRVARGDRVETGPDGRARARLDDGAQVVFDRSTRVVFAPEGADLAIEQGRALVTGAQGARTRIAIAGATAVVSDGVLAFTRTDAGALVYCASGEATLARGEEKRLRSGETAAVTAEGVTIAPEKAFNDWTGGMARPWSPTGKPRAAIGELWGRLSNVADGGTPLAVRSHEIEATLDAESATTKVTTTYFNAGNSAVAGDFRMAIPSGAVVSRFAVVEGRTRHEAEIAVASDGAQVRDNPRLEWAGDGWVRGATREIAPGATVALIVEYIEWLSPAEGRVTYRYPMAAEGKPPLLGEFRARIDASRANPVALHVGQGAVVSGATVELKRADFRPASDLVVELELRPNTLGDARGYVAPPASKLDTSGAYVMVRTEVPRAPADAGVTLALVVDTSLSIDPAHLEAERALVEAIVEGLGATDRVAVFSADQVARPVGPPGLGAVTPERRAALREALSSLRPGGATDLGVALERAADALPADAPAAMVIYVGDGWPTLGDATVDALRARLARRPGGVPRLGAVAVGPTANRFGLTALVRGSGPVLEVADRENAGEVAVHLLAEALKPAVAGVELDLGPDVERVYPRGARTVLAGGTITVVGRFRSKPPRSAKLRFREGDRTVERHLDLHLPAVTNPLDIRRRWGAARIDELTLREEGKEASIDVARQLGLLTPWTAWYVDYGARDRTYAPSPLDARVLDLAAMQNAPLSARVATPSLGMGTLLGPTSEPENDAKEADDELRRAVEFTVRRRLDELLPAVRACRDSRAALRPEISGHLSVRVEVDGAGKPTKVEVRGWAAPDDDPALDRCVQTVISNVTFFDGGQKTQIVVTHELRLPPPRQLRGHTCSRTAALPLPVRRGVWRERITRASVNARADIYRDAKADCELPTWTDRRALLELLLAAIPDGPGRVAAARTIDDAGDTDAAALLRREAVRRAQSPAELTAVRLALLGNEPRPAGAFRKAYRDAGENQARLAVVRRFLAVSPHDGGLRRQALALLEALGKRDELIAEIQRNRQDPFADAALLSDGAAALRRLGDADEARRAFGELVERAPQDPFARAFVGDRLRNEGLFDDATIAFETLSTFLPDEPAVTMRLGLAHADAGRLDVASRMLERVARTGGRLGSERLGELAAVLDLVLIEAARANPATPEPDRARLARRALEIPLPEAAAFALVRSPVLDTPIEASLVRGDGKDELASAATHPTPGLGLHGLRIERGDRNIRIRLRRPRALEPSRAVPVHIDVVLRDDGSAPPRRVGRTLELAADGKPVDLRWDGTQLL